MAEKYGLKVAYRDFKCKNCDHVQTMSTNHEGECFNYCNNCSWKPSFGNPEYQIPMFGRTYRPFAFCGEPGQTTYGQ